MINIKDKIIVLLPEEESNEGSIRVRIKRGAFGSGEHETTRSCLEVMCDIDFKDKTVLDIGCGTGILGIVAALLGARKVVALDIAKEAIETTSINIKLNNVEDRFKLYPYPIELLEDDGPFDVILANIYGDVIKRIVGHIDKRLKEKGLVLLSGVSYEDNFEIIYSFKKLGYNMIKNLYLEEYTTILLQKCY